MSSDNIPEHPSRLNVYNKFYNLFQNFINKSMVSEDEILRKISIICINLEKSVFNASIDKYTGVSKTWNDQFKVQYTITSVKLYRILNNNKLLHKIINNTLDTHYSDIVTMNANELKEL